MAPNRQCGTRPKTGSTRKNPSCCGLWENWGERDRLSGRPLCAERRGSLHPLFDTGPQRAGTDRAAGPVLDAILSNHNYPPLLTGLLAEALTLTALLGSTLKEAGGQLTLQAQAQGGVIDLLVCDYQAGALRGYIRHDPDRPDVLHENNRKSDV